MIKLFRTVQRIIKKMWSYLLIQILNIEINETRSINGILLIVNRLEKGGKAYFSKRSFQEVINPFYKLVQETYNPDVVLDIGANYGFTSNLFANVFKNAEVFAVEPVRNYADILILTRK